VEDLTKFSLRSHRDPGAISVGVVPTTPKDPAVIRARRKRTPNPGEILAGCSRTSLTDLWEFRADTSRSVWYPVNFCSREGCDVVHILEPWQQDVG
jgi:hypothetical protein